MNPKAEVLVVDTTAFIKNATLHDLGGQIVTIQDVVSEITNKRQLRRLAVLPHDLQIKDVFPENVVHVTEFSKKTGDYPSLSATDIKIMALTYQLEKEKVGTDHLRMEPQMNRVITFKHHMPDELKTTAGFYFPNRKDEVENEITDTEVNEVESLNITDKNESQDETTNEIHLDNILVPVKNNEVVEFSDEEEEEEEEDDDDDDDAYNCESESNEEDSDSEWITPQNIAHKKHEINCGETDKVVKVACITSDFAMQNVLKHMGLNVMSTDGRHIEQLRSFILRCYACFKTTSVMTKVFCPNCGNKTLKKVAVSLNEDGTQMIHLSSKKRLSGRGKRFSLPTPKGGKHANNPILCEDQRIPEQRPSRLARTKNNPLHPDYIAGFSPFVMRDVNSRSAKLGIFGTSNLKEALRYSNDRRKGKKKK